MKQEYIVTIRLASRDPITDELIAHTTGVDILLQENDNGHLMFPNDIFLTARALLGDAEMTNGGLQ